ncbi:MAG: hypothetical protein HZA01_14750 [Nitrospinae bacterium]|nr:hypothetical protein [Nitrospinota bacterium]
MPYTDTLQIYDVLRKEFDESKAKAIAASIEIALESNNGILLEKVATKEDIIKLRAEIKNDMADLKAEFKTELAGQKTEMGSLIAGLKIEMANQKTEIIRMNFLFWLGLIPVMATLIKFIR